MDDQLLDWGELHKMAGAVRGLVQGVQKALEYFGPDPFPAGEIDDDDLRLALRESVNSLAEAQIRFADSLETQSKAKTLGVSSLAWNSISDSALILRELTDLANAYQLGRLGKAVRLALRGAKLVIGEHRASVNSNRRKEAEKHANEVRRLLAILSLRRILGHAGQVLHSVYGSLQKGRPVGIHPSTGIADMGKCLNTVVVEMHAQMEARGIGLTRSDNLTGVLVTCDQTELIAAIAQLLDNAIKNTGHEKNSPRHDSTWITVRSRVDDRVATLEIENWGTPVTYEEFEGDLLFIDGYRGRHAQKRNIPGTGLGLTEVRNFAVGIGGNVTIGTNPVGKRASSDTEATVTLAISIPRLRQLTDSETKP